MRLLPFFFLVLAGSLAAGESTRIYPLWDGTESVADYARRADLPPTQSLDLGNGVKLELVLIPAGTFMMGTAEPPPVDEEGFHRKIVTGQALLALSAVALLVMLAVVIVRSIRKRRRPQLSLKLLLLVTVAAGGCVLSGLHWRQSARALDKARTEYPAAKARYDATLGVPCQRPGHSVTLTRPFYMGKFPVTQEEYQAVVGTNPSHFKVSDNPVEMVSWEDAQAFCKKLSEMKSADVRLPTEAEWEHGCRAGTSTTYYSGDSEKDLDRVAWYEENSKNTTHPVGQKEPNALGLYDMHGNIWQWCRDYWDENYYAKSPLKDPTGPAQGDFRVTRSGSYNGGKWNCQSGFRYAFKSDTRVWSIGFRIVVSTSSQP